MRLNFIATKKVVILFLITLNASKNPRDRKQAEKIQDYIEALSREGKAAGLPYIKHIKDELWELRPAHDRIFFIAWIGKSFVLLHPFTKKTRKTPPQEIEKAFREIADLKERGLPEDE